MGDFSFRDDVSDLGTIRERRSLMREIIGIEREELGLPPLDLKAARARRTLQSAHIARISTPVCRPASVFTNYIRAPRSLRGRGLRSPDELFSPDNDGVFWLYDFQKVTQSTIGNQVAVTAADVRKSAVCIEVARKVDSLMHQAAQRSRCGLLFDIISTSKIIKGGIPHLIGAFIYEYIERKHSNITSLKFVFVGITDNVNCCAARDVFCRDEILNGEYIADRKRTFEALDNVHMFPVFPGHHIAKRVTEASSRPPIPHRLRSKSPLKKTSPKPISKPVKSSSQPRGPRSVSEREAALAVEAILGPSVSAFLTQPGGLPPRPHTSTK